MITSNLFDGVEINPKDKKETFIHAAINCIVDHGYAETTVRKIAKYANVTPGLLVHYFEGKEDLIAQTYLYLSKYLLERFSKQRNIENVDSIEVLKIFFAVRIESETLNPKILRVWLTFWTMTLTRSDMKHIHEEIYENALEEMKGMLTKACESSELYLEPQKIHRAATGINALFDGLWLEWSLNPSTFSAEEALLIVTEFTEGVTGLKLT